MVYGWIQFKNLNTLKGINFIMFKNYLIVFLVSMLPLIELRGAIPIAESMNLNIWVYYIVAIIGNMIPVPFIYLFARKLLEWGKDKKIIGKFFTFCLEKGQKGGEKLKESAGNKGIFWALMIFVGIPIPGTGAWTGTLAASILDIDFKTSILAVSLGVILAGIIMSVSSKVVALFGWVGVFIIVLIIAIIVCLYYLIKKFHNNKTTTTK